MNKAWWIKTFAPILLRIFMPFRIPWSLLARRIQRENARMQVTHYETPKDLERAMRAFQYRSDPLDGNMDYVSHPEYVEWALHNSRKDGDCDDGHGYVANALRYIDGVSEVYLLSNGYHSKKTGKTGAHCTAVYRFKDKWYHYDWGIHEIDRPQDAPLAVAKRYTGGDDAEVLYCVWENYQETGKDHSGWSLNGVGVDSLVTRSL